MADGHGVQVVVLEDDHTYSLDTEELKKILERDDVKDLPVAVVSVVGAYRGGKSFLMNFFLKYLMAPQSSRDDGTWLGGDEEPLRGFSWRGGSKRNTTGILLWSEPMFCTTSTGEKIAVLLMDTQGTFDATSSVRDCSTIFALSTLMSSVQIYNISKNIKEDDLEFLQLFTNYGKLVTDDNGKAFQVLEFLIRDWPFPWEYEYGGDGGKLYIENKLKVESDQPAELQDLRRHIRSCFEKVTCFLMPHPGLLVLSPKFSGKNNEISADFKTYVKQLATSLFGPDKLCVKHVHGSPVKASELTVYLKTYMDIFNSNQLPTPTTILKATSEATLQLAFNDAQKLYHRTMETACGSNRPSMAADVLRSEHTSAADTATKFFLEKKKMAPEDIVAKMLTELNKNLEHRLNEYLAMNTTKLYLAMNEAKESYDKYIDTVRHGKPFCVHPLDVTRIHNDAVTAAMKTFDLHRRASDVDKERQTFLEGSVPNCDSGTEPFVREFCTWSGFLFFNELQQGFKDKLVYLETSNDQNNKLAVNEVKTWYWDQMYAEINKSTKTQRELNSLHLSYLGTSLSKLKEARLLVDERPDVYSQRLKEKISPLFDNLKVINDNNLERQRIIQEEIERNRRERERARERQREWEREQRREWEREQRRKWEREQEKEKSSCAIL